MLSAQEYQDDLLEYAADLPVIDTHEHFATEAEHLNINYNFFHWMKPYIQFDLYAAGMPKKWLWSDPSPEELPDYWQVISSLWRYVRNGSYERPMRMALKAFWGIDDIDDTNYLLIGELLNRNKYPGHYQKILKEKCHIEYILNQTERACYEDSYMKGSISIAARHFWKEVPNLAKTNPTLSLDEYLETVKNDMLAAKTAGAVLAKFDASCFLSRPDRAVALVEFDDLKNYGKIQYNSCLSAYFYDQCLEYCKECDLIAAVHTGVWYDINEKNPELLFPVVQRHPDVIFDIYHMGMPYVRECVYLGKNFQNVYLNLCWSHIVSDEMTRHALNEWMDILPTNKVFGFGGDFSTIPENIWAHLQLAKENISHVLAQRIVRQKLDLDEAKQILKMWLYDNPKRVYRL